MGGDSAYPFCDVNWGRLCLKRTSNSRTCKYIQVLVMSFTFQKGFFLAFFRQCRPGLLLLDAAKQLNMGSVCKVVRCDVFSSAVQQTLWVVVLRESGIHYTFWHEEKSSFLKHDAIPTIYPASGEVEEGTWKTKRT